MTEHRRPVIPFTDAPRGQCRWCGKEILYEEGPHKGQLNRRRRWHERCVEIYNESDPREARRAVRKRDRCICASCQLDTRALKREFRGRGGTRILRERGFVPRRSLWELDHIVPLIDGGGHKLENLQTLCTPCHKIKTAREARERADNGLAGPSSAAGRVAEVEASSARSGQEGNPSTGDGAASADRERADTRKKFEEKPAKTRRRRRGGPKPDLDSLLEAANRLNERVQRELAKFDEAP